jgi:hypothetical protein
MDYKGGWAGDLQAISYVWDQDGLWVGGLFDNCNTGSVPFHRYCLSSENASGDMVTDPVTGDLYYFGGWEGETRVYKITGWNNWVRMRAKMDNTLADVTTTQDPGTQAESSSLKKQPEAFRIAQAAGCFTIDVPASIKSLRVYDLRGRLVTDLTGSVRNSRAIWRPRGLTSGVYVIKLASAKLNAAKAIAIVK